MKRVGPLIERIRTEIPAVGGEIAHGIIESGDESQGEKALEEIKAIRYDYEALCRYRYFMSGGVMEVPARHHSNTPFRATSQLSSSPRYSGAGSAIHMAEVWADAP